MNREDLASYVQNSRNRIHEQVKKLVVGNETAVDRIIATIFMGHHCLLTGAPGTGKTTIIRSVAETMDLTTARVQGAPDIMPADILGSEVLEEDLNGERSFVFHEGPIFNNLVVVDEINRMYTKSQAAFLGVMEEGVVNIERTQRNLPKPFSILASQNTNNQEGTYPLPEAQLDRFTFCISLNDPSLENEIELLTTDAARQCEKAELVISRRELIEFGIEIGALPISEFLAEKCVSLCQLSRPMNTESPDFIKEMVSFGASSRGSIALAKAAQISAMFNGRIEAKLEDIADMAHSVLEHRIVTTFNAEAAGVTSANIIDRLLENLA